MSQALDIQEYTKGAAGGHASALSSLYDRGYPGRNWMGAMPFVPTPGAVEAELVYLWDNQICENTLGFAASGAFTTDDMLALAGALETWWEASYGPNVSDSVSLTMVRVRDLATATSPTVEFTTGLPITGSNTSPSMPNNVALCLSLKSGFGGRSARGRNYIVGACENQVTQNRFLDAFVDNMVDAYNELVGAGTFVPGWQLAVISRRHNNADRTTGLVTPITNAVAVDRTVDSQRRRLPGRGN